LVLKEIRRISQDWPAFIQTGDSCGVCGGQWSLVIGCQKVVRKWSEGCDFGFVFLNLFGAWDLVLGISLAFGAWNFFSIWCLEFGICLVLGIWCLEFPPL
jgi:hypothetical protein